MNNGLWHGCVQTDIGGLHLRHGAHGFNRLFMSFLQPRHLLILVLVPLLAACGVGSNLGNVSCPSVRVLTLAERLPLGDNKAARLTAVSMSCEKNRNSGALLAEVELFGTSSQGEISLPVFVASLASNGDIVQRSQHTITSTGGGFSVELPSFEYGNSQQGQTPNRVVVGFVLSEDQHGDNRAAWRKAMGLN